MPIVLARRKGKEPVYRQLTEILRQEVSRRKPGDVFFSDTALKRSYGLNIMTVRRAVSELVEEGLVSRVVGKGTFVRSTGVSGTDQADTASRKKLRNVGFSIADVVIQDQHKHGSTTLIGLDYLRGVMEAAAEAETKISLVPFSRIANGGLWPFIEANKLEGLVIAGFAGYEPIFVELQGRHYPFAVCGTEDKSLSGSETNSRKGVFEAVDYLLGLGHERVAFVGYAGEERVKLRERFLGYQDALRLNGVSLNQEYVFNTESDLQKAYDGTRNLLRLERPPTAVVTSNDYQAFRIMQAIKDSGKRVPADISVIGYDGIPEGETTDPPLTSVWVDRYLMGRTAFRILEQVHAKVSEGPIRRMIRTELVVRKSCRQIPKE